MVMLLIMSFDVMQYLYRLLRIGRFDEYFLETAFQCTVLLNGVTVFVKCCGTDALDGASCQCGFQDIGGIH